MRILGLAFVTCSILCAASLHASASDPRFPSEDIVDANAKGDSSIDGKDSDDWSWDRILRSGEKIVANGNTWPPSNGEAANDCLMLVTHNQCMWHCPDGEETVLYRGVRRFRGVLSVPGTENRRLWLLDSNVQHDTLMELDTVAGRIVQSLRIKGTVDGHDAVRVDDRIFMVDTRHGHIVEIQLPASAPPYTESSIQAGAKKVKQPGFVDIVKRHTGFTRFDHINNVAVGKDLLITSLHGGKGILSRMQKEQGVPLSATRLSALLRSTPENEGRELTLQQDGFTAIDNVGNMCHGIAFWEDKASSQIKLISLDSKAGTLVSVVLSGSNEGEREILWEPDLSHPVLAVPPELAAEAFQDRANAFREGVSGANVFSKGLAVQGGVAYFGVSYARAPALRQTVPENLLVAVDLTTKEELWTRTIHSNGLINQIVTQSYLGGKVQLPPDHPSIERTHYGTGRKSVETCNDPSGDDSSVCKA